MSNELDLMTTYRAILGAARERRFISYGDLAKANGANWQKVRYKLNEHLGQLVALAVERGWPMPSAIVVNKASVESGALDGSARDGFVAAARANGIVVGDPDEFVRQQQTALFDWAVTAPDNPDFPVSVPEDANAPPGPKFVRYFGPVLDALHDLGGSAPPRDVMDRVRASERISDEEADATTKSGQSKFENWLGWARFYLVKGGFIDASKRGRWELTPLGKETHLDHDMALALFKDVASRFRGGGEQDEEALPPEDGHESLDLFEDPDRRFWFAGAMWNGSDDQTDRFLVEGIWQNAFEDRFSDLVDRMKPGDRIAIKASFVRKLGLPFDNREKSVSCMRIKATGVITEASTDRRTVKVDWAPLAIPKEWYFYTYRITLVEADPSDEFARRLIRFAFGDQRQDYDFWLRVPYFAKKYISADPDAPESEREGEEVDPDEATVEPYGISNIIGEGCFLSEAELESALRRLRDKKNLILQGPPGTGKTWLAKRLAYALIDTRDRRIAGKRIRAIQFHPSLSYEDFVRGWRPDGDGRLSLVDGVFLEAIEAARAEADRPFVLVIEEINRGNPAQIFGEMLTLLEKDKRRSEEAIDLAYHRGTEGPVFIPDNLYVIGTMNIADRSLALVDLALRRRFAFVSLQPQLNERWKAWCLEQAGMTAVAAEAIKKAMTTLNAEIEADRSLGAQFRIGHSYVTPSLGEKVGDARAWFRRIVETEIGPLLEEYWFDNLDKARTSTQRLLESF